MRRYQVSSLSKHLCCLKLAFCCYYLCPSLTFGFCFCGHCSLHIIRQSDIFYLYSCHLCSPWLGVSIDDIFNLDIYISCFGKELVERKTTNHVSYCCLAYLVDRIMHIFNSNNRFLGINNVVIRHSGNIYGDIVFGNNLLRWNIHRDCPQSNLSHALKNRNQNDESWTTHTSAFTQQNYNCKDYVYHEGIITLLLKLAVWVAGCLDLTPCRPKIRILFKKLHSLCL